MKILILGNEEQQEAIASKLNPDFTIKKSDDYGDLEGSFFLYDVVFDCLIDESPEYFDLYEDNKSTIVFLNSVNTTLAELQHMYGPYEWPLFGFNALPYFIDLPKWEISVMRKDDEQVLSKIMAQLGQEFLAVDDRAGMVAPRVICMIINEAYYTLQEGTAGKNDIDTGMKLGTNYPYGPFEWTNLIGIDKVYELLEAMYEDTKDERYKICPLLKKEYLLAN